MTNHTAKNGGMQDSLHTIPPKHPTNWELLSQPEWETDTEAVATVQHEAQEPTFYARVPKLAIMSLDPYELALYCNYKQTASEHGKCTKSNGTLAKETQMSATKVQRARRGLHEKGFITLTYEPDENGVINKPPIIKIVNIWQKNHDTYTTTPSPTYQGDSPEYQGGKSHVPPKKNHRRRTKDSPTSDDMGNEPPPKKEKKPRTPKQPKEKTPDVVFDTIAECAYGIKDTSNVSNGSTIGSLKKVAVEQFTLEYGQAEPDVIAKTVRMFAASRRGFPQYQSTFEAPYIAYLQTHRPAIQALISGIPPSNGSNGNGHGKNTAGLDDVTGGGS